jgi:membrane protease YdiL (CAAX protease family)
VTRDPVTAAPPSPLRVPARRAALATVLLAGVWAVAFGASGLPFFPLIAAGGIVTGLAGLWVRRPLAASSGPAASWPPTLRLDRRGALLAAGVALVHLGVSHLLFRLGSALLPHLAPTAEQVFGRTGGVPLWWAVLLGAVVTAPLEEMFWRGAAQPLVTDALRRRAPRVAATPWAVVGLSGVLYAAFHVVTGHLALVAAALLGGLVWGWLLERTRSVGACMLAHGLWATGILLLPPV